MLRSSFQIPRPRNHPRAFLVIYTVVVDVENYEGLKGFSGYSEINTCTIFTAYRQYQTLLMSHINRAEVVIGKKSRTQGTHIPCGRDKKITESNRNRLHKSCYWHYYYYCKLILFSHVSYHKYYKMSLLFQTPGHARL